MNIVLTAINSSFTHINLAVRYLKKAAQNKGFDVKILEFNINMRFENIFREIIESRADVLCFSVYIWNIEYVLKIAKEYKKLFPKCKIILGGPEVTFEYKEIIKEPFTDYIILGEGENVFIELLKIIENNESCDETDFIVTKNATKKKIAKSDILAFDRIYSSEEIENKII